MGTQLAERSVAKKKPSPKADPKRSGTMIRVSDEFAEVYRKACALHNLNAAEFADLHLLPHVRKVYRDLLAKESKMEG